MGHDPSVVFAPTVHDQLTLPMPSAIFAVRLCAELGPEAYVTVIVQLAPGVVRTVTCPVPPRRTGERTDVKVTVAGGDVGATVGTGVGAGVVAEVRGGVGAAAGAGAAVACGVAEVVPLGAAVARRSGSRVLGEATEPQAAARRSTTPSFMADRLTTTLRRVEPCVLDAHSGHP